MRKMFFIVMVMALPCGARAQSTPPIKMGLWRGTTVMTMTGLQLPPETAARLKAMGRTAPGSEPTTTEMESCLTSEKWKEMLTGTQGKENCKYTTTKMDFKGMSADMVCAAESGGAAKGHLEMNFLSPEKVHGTVHMEVTSQRQPQPILMNITVDNTYEGSDCKGISPEDPKVIR
jgi:hypothetical protein